MAFRKCISCHCAFFQAIVSVKSWIDKLRTTLLVVYIFSGYMHLQEVSRLLLGMNCGKAITTLALPDAATALASEYSFDIQVSCFSMFYLQNYSIPCR